VSSAIAAPASAGIPVTHREHASGFLVVSGHDREVFTSAVHNLKPNGITVVILMGFSRRVELTGELLAAGWNHTTPAAIVADGTLPNESAWRGTLGDIAEGRATLETEGPAVIVIGEVAALQLNGRASASDASPADEAEGSDGRRAAQR